MPVDLWDSNPNGMWTKDLVEKLETRQNLIFSLENDNKYVYLLT